MNAIEIKNLCKEFKVLNRREGLIGAFKDLFSGDYKYINAVNNISMEVRKGEILGLLGPNGAGKSTTIKMMTGILEPTRGDISVNGRRPYKNRAANMMNIGVVIGQRSQLWWELPVIESFKILREIYKVDKKIYEENLNIFNELVDLKALYSTPVRHLSLGQRMLCDIVASFLHDPSIIFLDEPTIGLDVSIKNKIRTVIKHLNKIKGTTIILTTHDLSDIEALCERIIIIDKGIVIFDGNIEKVSHMFGAFRTLRIKFIEGVPDINIISDYINEAIICKTPIKTENSSNQWIDFIINQDEVVLLDVLSCLTNKYPINDIKIEEINIERVIRNIYEGGLKN